MSEPLIMPVKPGVLSEADKASLREAGVIVIECQRPQDLRLIRPCVDLEASDMLRCAAQAIRSAGYNDVKVAFAHAICDALKAKSA